MQKRFQIAGCLAVIVLVVLALAFSQRPRTESAANTILEAKRACEAQTGKPCSVP